MYVRDPNQRARHYYHVDDQAAANCPGPGTASVCVSYSCPSLRSSTEPWKHIPVLPVSEVFQCFTQGFCLRSHQIRRGGPDLHQRVILRFKIFGESKKYSDGIPFLLCRCRRQTMRISKISARCRNYSMNHISLYRIYWSGYIQFRSLGNFSVDLPLS